MVDLSTSNVIDTKSGTGWTITVTACNLLPDLSIKDFVVLIYSVLEPNSNITKTSQTVLTYTGASISSSTVEVRRVTPQDRFQDITFAEKFSSTVYNEEVDRLIRKAYEYTLNGIGPGSVATTVTPLNEAYPGTWSGDTVRSRTANRLFTEFEARGTLAEDEAITGNWTAPTQTDGNNSTRLSTTAYADTRVTNALASSPSLGGNPTATTQAAGNNSTRIATTAFVHDFPVWRRIGQVLGDGVSISETFDIDGILTDAPTKIKLEWTHGEDTVSPAIMLGINGDTAYTPANAFVISSNGGAWTTGIDNTNIAGSRFVLLGTGGTLNYAEGETVLSLDTVANRMQLRTYMVRRQATLINIMLRTGTTGTDFTQSSITELVFYGYQHLSNTTKAISSTFSCDIFALQP